MKKLLSFLCVGAFLFFLIAVFYERTKNPLVEYYVNGKKVFSCPFECEHVYDCSKNACILEMTETSAIALLTTFSKNDIRVGDFIDVHINGESVSCGESCFNSDDCLSILALSFPPKFIFAQMSTVQKDLFLRRMGEKSVVENNTFSWKESHEIPQGEWAYTSFSNKQMKIRVQRLREFFLFSDPTFKKQIDDGSWDASDVENYLFHFLLSSRIPPHGFLFFEPMKSSFVNFPELQTTVSDLKNSVAFLANECN